MSHPYFISDLHLGHKRVLNFNNVFDDGKIYRQGNNIEEHDQWLIDSINSKVNKRDKLFILGDVAMNLTSLDRLKELHCRNKLLIRGNHDVFPLHKYLEHFIDVQGALKYKEFILTHIPIHPQELYRWKNVHGHCHLKSVPDTEHYLNVCVEQVNGVPLSLEEVRERFHA